MSTQAKEKLAKYSSASITLSIAAGDLLSPVISKLQEVQNYLETGELLAAQGTFLGLDDQFDELKFILKAMARVAKTDRA